METFATVKVGVGATEMGLSVALVLAITLTATTGKLPSVGSRML